MIFMHYSEKTAFEKIERKAEACPYLFQKNQQKRPDLMMFDEKRV